MGRGKRRQSAARGQGGISPTPATAATPSEGLRIRLLVEWPIDSGSGSFPATESAEVDAYPALELWAAADDVYLKGICSWACYELAHLNEDLDFDQDAVGYLAGAAASCAGVAEPSLASDWASVVELDFEALIEWQAANPRASARMSELALAEGYLWNASRRTLEAITGEFTPVANPRIRPSELAARRS